MMGYNIGGGPLHALGPHQQQQFDLVTKCRLESSQHHHARIAASKSRMNLNIQSAQISSVNPGPASPAAPGGQAASADHRDGEKPADSVVYKWTSLDMGGMLISNLSSMVFRYDFLTCLYLNHNNLRVISPEISALKHLAVLNLTANKLTAVPSELGLVVSLKELLLFDNQISYLPFELGQLYQLEILGLEGNPLNEALAKMIHNDGTKAVIMHFRENCNSGAPPLDREWIQIDDDSSASPQDSFTVMCYNTLCEKYASAQAYGYTPAWALSWAYRKDLLLQDILNYNADIICLQVTSFHPGSRKWTIRRLFQAATCAARCI